MYPFLFAVLRARFAASARLPAYYILFPAKRKAFERFIPFLSAPPPAAPPPLRRRPRRGRPLRPREKPPPGGVAVRHPCFPHRFSLQIFYQNPPPKANKKAASFSSGLLYLTKFVPEVGGYRHIRAVGHGDIGVHEDIVLHHHAVQPAVAGNVRLLLTGRAV